MITYLRQLSIMILTKIHS